MTNTASPKITVLIACYNAHATIARAIESVLTQTEQNFEIMIVDDGSTDNTTNIVKTYSDPRISLISMATNRGPSSARNAGLEKAKGQWIAILDADDFFEPSRLETVLNHAQTSKADIVSDCLKQVDENGTLLDIFPGKDSLTQDTITTEFYLNHPDLGYLKPLFRRAFLEHHALFYDPDLRLAEDYDFVLRALLKGARYVFNKSVNYNYTRHAHSTSYRAKTDQINALITKTYKLADTHKTYRGLLLRRARHLKNWRAVEEVIPALKNKNVASVLPQILKRPVLVRDIYRLWRKSRKQSEVI